MLFYDASVLSTSMEDRCILSLLNMVCSGLALWVSTVKWPLCRCRPFCLFSCTRRLGSNRGCGGGVGWGGCIGVCIANSYLNSASPSPSSHCGLYTLILCAGNRDPRIHWWLDRTNVIAILLLTYPHIFQ